MHTGSQSFLFRISWQKLGQEIFSCMCGRDLYGHCVFEGADQGRSCQLPGRLAWSVCPVIKTHVRRPSLTNVREYKGKQFCIRRSEYLTLEPGMRESMVSFHGFKFSPLLKPNDENLSESSLIFAVNQPAYSSSCPVQQPCLLHTSSERQESLRGR